MANVHGFARRLIESSSLDEKLALPGRLDDGEPGPAMRLAEPGRPPELVIAPARSVKVPPAAGMSDPAQRGRILHALANHELQAAELFAWALLAFPDAPAPFRRGLLAILADEQRHCQLYIECMSALGVTFGDYPVTGHFWGKIAAVATPLHFVCTMGLTFENANLDFAGEYARAAERAGDDQTCAVLDRVHRDEIRHVRFAWHWLRRLSEYRDSDGAQVAPHGDDAWAIYLDNIHWPLGPARARGRTFDRPSRVAAGLDDAFIDRLEQTQPKRPGGAPR
ncbi:MAG: DUF455 family protein [Myxococcota bacterium]